MIVHDMREIIVDTAGALVAISLALLVFWCVLCVLVRLLGM